jgi:hypothetical protein
MTLWIATTIGFFSIVEKPWDKENGTLTVRARVREDLEKFKAICLQKDEENANFFKSAPIVEDMKADYLYRLQLPFWAVQEVLSELISDIDYDNFKNAVAIEQGVFRSRLYGKVWAVLLELQTRVFKGRDHER